MPITQIWYPSHDYLSKKGILVGYYHFGETAEKTGRLSPAARLEQAMYQGGKIHPQYGDCYEHAFSVAWHKTPHSLGGWASYTTDLRETYYPTLTKPDGPVYLVGDHVSYQPGWMAGAFESAQRAVASIQEQTLAVSY